MKFKRKIYEKLVEWKKNRNGATALLIEGARRVGKSFVVEEFGRSEYDTFAMIDFSRPPPMTLDAILNHPHDLDRIFNAISLDYRVRLVPRRTLVAFDEVQLCPKARQLVKHLVADGRYDFVETGSLVTLKTNAENILIPSEEERIEMHPMDFGEFCSAMGDEVTVPYARERFEKLEPMGMAHATVMNRYCEYLCTGGMPQAVLKYLETKDVTATDAVKRSILSLYRDDIGKFAMQNAAKVRSLFDSIPSQLMRKEKRYVLSDLGGSARMREYENAFLWLADAKVALPCHNSTDPTVGLGMSVEHSTLKTYFLDTGLLISMALGDGRGTDAELYKAVFGGDVYFNFGMIAENAVAQSLVSGGRKLYFYSRRNPETHRNEMEIDFLIRRGGKICPVEVKSGRYRSHASLDAFGAKFGERIGERFILYPKDVQVKNGIVHLPLYMSMFL